MKKYRISFLLMLSVLLFGCEKKSVLNLKEEMFVYEFGEMISFNYEDYIQTDELSDKQKEDIELTINILDDEYVVNDETKYPKVGTYEGKITRSKEEVTFTIEVKDTTAPQVNGLSRIEIPVGTSLNYSEYFEINDLSEIESIECDDSQINYQNAGDYTLKVISKDTFLNETILEVPVTCIEVPSNKIASSEVITNENGQQEYRTNLIDRSSIIMDVPYYNQFALGAPVGCESVSLYMALQYKGYIPNMDCVSFISTTPRSYDNNPYHGFVGAVFDEHRYDILPAIFPSAFTPWANQYGIAVDISGMGTEEVINQLLSGNPVVVWATAYFKPIVWQEFDWGRGFKNTHTVCLVGVDKDLGVIYYNDPVTTKNEVVDIETFRSIYEVQNFGVAIL